MRKGMRRDKSPVKKSNNVCSYSALKDWEHNSPLLCVGSTWSLPSKEYSIGRRGKKNNFTVEKLDKRFLSRVFKVNINSDRSC